MVAARDRDARTCARLWAAAGARRTAFQVEEIQRYEGCSGDDSGVVVTVLALATKRTSVGSLGVVVAFDHLRRGAAVLALPEGKGMAEPAAASWAVGLLEAVGCR